MKKRTVQPKSGQFVAVWEWEGQCWSRTIKIEHDGQWYHLCTVDYAWVKSNLTPDTLESLSPAYFVKGE